MSLVLRNLDSKCEIVLNKETPLVIGRGDSTGCSDKRVSRKHGQLTCTADNKLQVLALHTNPCFIMKNGLPPVSQLKKDEEKILTEGDYFGLLPDAFWFEIIFKDSSKNSADHKNCNVSSSNENSPEPRTNDDSSLQSKGDASHCTVNTSADKSKSNEPSTSNCVKLPNLKIIHSEHEPDALITYDAEFANVGCKMSSNLEKTKKLPLWMYEIDDEPKDETQAKPTPFKRPHSSSADDVLEKKIKVDETSVGNNEKYRGSTGNQEESENVTVEKENMNKSEDIIEVKTEFKEKESEEKTVEESKNSGESSKGKGEKDGYESDVVEPDESNEASNPPRGRPICQYEASCYRKNPVHKQEYCHPGDADYVRPENRPQCPYGASCYRQNQLHRVEYQHPTSTPAPRPQPQSPASPASPLPLKRKPKTCEANARQSSDEEDDYDLEDPFINDASSDEYAPSESSSEQDEDEF